jgi:flagellin
VPGFWLGDQNYRVKRQSAKEHILTIPVELKQHQGPSELMPKKSKFQYKVQFLDEINNFLFEINDLFRSTKSKLKNTIFGMSLANHKNNDLARNLSMTGINTNVNSLYAQASLSSNQNLQTAAMQQLSTGNRINSARDDAAGLAVSTTMNTNVRGMAIAIKNANDGISLAQTAESALGSMTTLLQRMRELVVEAANGTLSSNNKDNIQIEINQLKQEINIISKTTNFNGIKIFDGSTFNLDLQTNNNVGDTVKMNFDTVNASTLGATKRAALSGIGYSKLNVLPGQLNDGLLTGDLKVNGVTIGSSLDADDNSSTSDKSSSAISKAAAINRVKTLTGVEAIVGKTVASGYSMIAGIKGSTGKIQINGVTTDNIILTGDTSKDRKAAVNAINSESGHTGVRAIDTGGNGTGVQLIADDGRNIVCKISGDANFLPSSIGVNGTNDPLNYSIFTGTVLLQSHNNNKIQIGTTDVGNINHSGFVVSEYEPNKSYVCTARRPMAVGEPVISGAGIAYDISSSPPLALNDGDLKINGFNIPASLANDDNASDNSVSTSIKEGSAIAIAAAINKIYNKTGVLAKPNPNVVVGKQFYPNWGKLTLSNGFPANNSLQGDLLINGVSIHFNLSSPPKKSDVIDNINSASGATGVKASDNGSGITLIAEDGRNITVRSNGGADPAIDPGNLGIGADGPWYNAKDPLESGADHGTDLDDIDDFMVYTSYSTVSLISDKPFEIKGGDTSKALEEIKQLGFQEGVFGGDENGVKIQNVDIKTEWNLSDAFLAIDGALKQVSDMRSDLGAIQNRLSNAIENLTSTKTNTEVSSSRISDTDYGFSVTSLARSQIINQAATAMLAQSNQQPQLILQLLKNSG